jgi:hypothetical protein
MTCYKVWPIQSNRQRSATLAQWSSLPYSYCWIPGIPNCIAGLMWGRGDCYSNHNTDRGVGPRIHWAKPGILYYPRPGSHTIPGNWPRAGNHRSRPTITHLYWTRRVSSFLYHVSWAGGLPPRERQTSSTVWARLMVSPSV